MQAPDDALASYNGWEQLRHNALYQYYQLPAHARSWADRVLNQPGCFCVEARPHMGKTALIRYLWNELAAQDFYVVGYIFASEQRTQVDDAIRLIRDHLRQLGLIEARSADAPSWLAHAERLEVPWFPLDQAAAHKPLAVLIDALDECDPAQWRMLGDLLPNLALKHAKLVVTSRLPLDRYNINMMLESIVQPDATLKLSNFSEDDVRALVAQSPSPAAADLVQRIFDRTHGRPLPVAAICRSGDPELALQSPPNDLRDIKLLGLRELESIERLVAAADKPLLRRLLAVLAIAPHPLTLIELHAILFLSEPALIPRPSQDDLDRLCKLLARHVRQEEHYKLVSPDLCEHIRCEEARGGIYGDDVRAARTAVAAWYRRSYDDARGPDLSHLPRHVLWFAPQFLLDASDPANFTGDKIFVDKRWRDALHDGFETLADMSDAVRNAWHAAARSPSRVARVLGVTACAITLTSLVPAFPPDAVANLMQRGLVTKEQAYRYSDTYASAKEREQLASLLRAGAAPPLDPAFDRAFTNLIEYPENERGLRLNLLHRKLAVVGPSKQATLLEMLRAAHRQSSQEASVPEQGHPLSVLIGQLEKVMRAEPPQGEPASLEAAPLMGSDVELVGLAYPEELLDSHTALLGEIAAVWAQDEPFSDDYYVKITRLIASGSRARYFDALSTLAPAISRVFGEPYVAQLIAIIEKLTRSYP